MKEQIAIGTCDGTGAAINVCLGFTPSYVKVFNLEDAGSLLPVVEWHRAMKFVAAMDEGVKHVGISDTDFDRTVLAADGISEYAGGDEITYDRNTDNRWETAAAASAEELYVDGHYQRSAATDPAYRCYGDAVLGTNPPHGAKVKTAAGFTIGADADLNADGEQLCWIAYR